MCGIAAAIRPHGACPACRAAGLGAFSQVHRGPNASGSVEIELPWCTVSLGMSRLKIVDQRDLAVPFQFDRLGVALAFNGEIYNWRELRRMLDGPWETECDAEVVAAAWREWGLDAFGRMNGMWSMALVDRISGAVILSRDRAGQKPLFYAAQADRLYIASEAKALPIQLEEKACADLEVFEYDVLEDTPLRGVKRLLPGSWIGLRSIDDLRDPLTHTWWSMPPAEPSEAHESRLTDELEALVLDAVRLRLIAEVPVALMVSGGLDSAVIQAAADRLGLEPKRYCITFPEIDNISQAKLAAGGRLVEGISFGREDMLATLPEVAYHLDTPGTWSSVCLWYLCQAIAQADHRVLISGEGADELFGGYTRYRVLHWLHRMLKDPHLVPAYVPTIMHAFGDPTAAAVRLLDRGGTPQSLARATELFETYRDLKRSLPMQLARVEFYTTMQVLLRMADRMAAAWSLENRCPFMDYRILEFSTRVPDRLLINDRESKSILRELARRWKVHPAITEERAKRGLAIPWSSWHANMGSGSRGEWDRKGFAGLMLAAWRTSFSRHISCDRLTSSSHKRRLPAVAGGG